MVLDDPKEKLQNDQEMEEGVVSPESEEYFSEIRDRTGENMTSSEDMENPTSEDLSNVGGVSKDEEFHSEIGQRPSSGMGETDEAGQDQDTGAYFETYDEDDDSL